MWNEMKKMGSVGITDLPTARQVKLAVEGRKKEIDVKSLYSRIEWGTSWDSFERVLLNLAMRGCIILSEGYKRSCVGIDVRVLGVYRWVGRGSNPWPRGIDVVDDRGMKVDFSEDDVKG